LAVALHRQGGHATIRGRTSAAQPSTMRRAVSNPSISGIWTSSRTRFVGLPTQGSEDLDAVARHVGPIAHAVEHLERHALVHRVVFGQQDPQRVPLAERAVDVPARRGFGRASSAAEQDAEQRVTQTGPSSLAWSAPAAIPRSGLASWSRRPSEVRITIGSACQRASPGCARQARGPSMPGHEHVEQGDVERRVLEQIKSPRVRWRP